VIFAVFTERGWHTPINAATTADAIEQLRLEFGRGDGQIRLGVVLLQGTATIVQAPDAANATVQVTGDALIQKQIRDLLTGGLADNITYLAIPAPTQQQITAQVRALTQQVNGLIKLATGNLA
jgi:hypothetical protein